MNYTFIIIAITLSTSLSVCMGSLDFLHSHANLWNAIMPTELPSGEEKWI
jgi:hypothetical protein